MLKCYCDRCKKETTAKFVSLQIKMKGADSTSKKHLCVSCWGRVLDVINKVPEEPVEINNVPTGKPALTELEERFYSTCYGVDSGRVCALYDANWLPQDIADEIGKDVSVVFTIIDMYDLYSEVPNTKECYLPARHEEVILEPEEPVEEEEEDSNLPVDTGNGKPIVPGANNAGKGPKCGKLSANPQFVDDYMDTVNKRANKRLIKEILLDVCTGLFNVRDLMAKYNVQYQFVNKYYLNYVRYCEDATMSKS